jgi:hypothetical protein
MDAITRWPVAVKFDWTKVQWTRLVVISKGEWTSIPLGADGWTTGAAAGNESSAKPEDSRRLRVQRDGDARFGLGWSIQRRTRNRAMKLKLKEKDLPPVQLWVTLRAAARQMLD